MDDEKSSMLFENITWWAMRLPPWNIFWWLVGLVLYLPLSLLLGGGSNSFMYLVVFAPVTLPMLPYVIYDEWREGRQIKKLRSEHVDMVQWIKSELRAQGIFVVEGPSDDGFVLTHMMTSTQSVAYSQVYAVAVRKFAGTFSINGICQTSRDAHPLNKEWAVTHGFDEWAEEVFECGCTICEVPRSVGWRFGRELLESARFGNDRVNTLKLRDGSTRVIIGHLCRECYKKITA